MIKFFDKSKFILILFFASLLFFSCLGNDSAKPLFEMTSKEKVIMMFDVYNTQYYSYMELTGYFMDTEGEWIKITSPDLSDDQRKMLQKKKKLLTALYPLISLYNSYILSDRLISQESERQIFSMLDSLVLLNPD